MSLINSASVLSIDPNTLQPQTFTPEDGNIIPNYVIDSLFSSQTDKIEFFIYDYNNNLLAADYNFTNWKINQDSSVTSSNEVGTLSLDPSSDVLNYGFDSGELKVIYNFISNQLGSSIDTNFYIDEISTDRTELRLKSNFISNSDLITYYNNFSSSVLANNDYFDEFYLNFGSNNYSIGINAILDSGSLLIKLYEPLINQFDVDSTLYIVTKPAESIAYNIKFNNITNIVDDITNIKGPNTNIPIKNIGGSTTEYQNETNILSTPNSGSLFQLNSLLDRGVEINADYTDFSSFVHFSSVKKRLENFYDKISLIESYQNDITNIYTISSASINSYSVSSSRIILENKINDIVSKFDGYEYYLYYESTSFAWPKTNSSYPYVLSSTGSVSGLTWYGSDIESNLYYGGIRLSASLFDNQNQDNLKYTIPEFIREDIDNNQYESFIYMIGQFFDILWLYTKGITDKLNADNRLLSGVSKDLIADVIRSLGVETYTNNFALQNLYTSFIGITPSGSYLPTTGNELINNYIAVNSGSYPYSIDDVNEEIYKRLYHNISYILKKKGTSQAIKELANIYGIPNTILRISEFGGRDKLQDTGDYWQNIFNYAFTTNGDTPGAGVGQPVGRIQFRDPAGNTPDTVLFRFKTPTFFSNNDYLTRQSQSLFTLTGTGLNELAPSVALTITYTGSLSTGSYSGSILNSYYQYGNVNLYVSGSTTGILSCSVYLPIYDGDWWSVMARRNTGSIDLFVKNKLYNGYDGNIIGFQASASILSSDTASWASPAAGVNNVLRVGGRAPFNNALSTLGTYLNFSGSLQEFRLYSEILNESAFDSFVLNPLSIEGNIPSGSQTAYNILTFRAPFGSDLIYQTSSFLTSADTTCYGLSSSHPSTTGSNPTSSYAGIAFICSPNGYTFPITSSFNQSWSFQPNTEYVFIKEPVAGIRNRVTNKIQSEENIVPSGSTLSQLISIQQHPLYSGSYTNDINYLEVVFSPQNEINDDISDQLGGFNISEFIADPRQRSSSLTYYPKLRSLSEDYFKKYIHPYDLWDYIRLIKYFDNSFFKLVKDFVPARTTLSSGILIKQHLLERNKYTLPTPDATTYVTNVASASTNIGYELGNLYLTASIGSTASLLDGQKIYISSDDFSSNPIETPSGGTGGVMPNDLIFTGLNSNLTQSWTGFNDTLVGLVAYTSSTQDEFYNGEFSGSSFSATTQRLTDEDCVDLLYAPTAIISYRPTLFRSSQFSYSQFLDVNTSPSSSEAYLFYDTGSLDIIPYTPPIEVR